MAKIPPPQTNRPLKKARTETDSSSSKKHRVKIVEPKSKNNKSKEKTSTSTPYIPAQAQIKPKPKPQNKGKSKANSTSDSNSTPIEESLPKTFKIVAGSYEKLLYGVEGKVTYSIPHPSSSSSSSPESQNQSQQPTLQFYLKPIFAFPAHISCIKSVAASPNGGKWLATGSSDEIIKVWDLRRRKEIGGLMHHEGSITHLLFPSRSHLFSASEDGTLCLFRARDWAVLRSLKGHKGRVNSMSVHPSGKVALSVGKDRALRMWDLMRGKGVASTKLGKEGEIVRWSTDGKLFAVQTGSTIDIYNTELVLLHTIQHPSRLHDLKFTKHPKSNQQLLLAGGEDKKLSIYSIPNSESIQPQPPIIIAQMIGHGNRVKAIQTLEISLPQPQESESESESERKSTTIITTVSSDGKIRLFDLYSVPTTPDDENTTTNDNNNNNNNNKDKNGIIEIEPVAEYDTGGTRLTCVTMADGDIQEIGSGGLIGKRKVRDEDEDEDESDEDEDEEEGFKGITMADSGSGSDEDVDEDVDEDEGEGEDEDEDEEEDEDEDEEEGEED